MSEIKSNFRISLGLAQIMAFKRSMKPSHATRNWICADLFDWRRSAFLSWSTLWYFLVPCFPKYSRHNSPTDWHPEILVAIVRWKWSEETHCLTILGLWPKCLRAQGFNASSSIFLQYYLAFILTPRSINTCEEEPSAVMAADTITIAGAWVLVANRRCTFSAYLFGK